MTLEKTLAFFNKPLGYVPAFVALILGYFVFEAWYQSGTGIITVKDIGINSPDRKNHLVEDVSGAYFVVRGARYPMFGGVNADQVWRVLKVGCRYEIAFYYYSSGDQLLSRDGMAISDATLIDCPPPEPKEPPPSAREIMERLIRRQ